MITTEHANDLKLLEGLKAGDRAALDEIYKTCFRQVRIMISKSQGNEDDASDAFQEALMSLFKRVQKGDFELRCKLSSYIQVMCRNIWLTYQRKASRVSSIDDSFDEPVEMDELVVAQMEGAEKRRLFYQHFAKLGEDCRNILEKFFQKIPMAKIAEELGTTEAYIKKRKFVCKDRLVKMIQKDPVFEELYEGS